MTHPSSRTAYLRIGQVASRTGVSAKALRLYEVRGLLQPDAFAQDGTRLYAAPALARLHEICVLKRAGFVLDDIGRLLAGRGAAAALVETRIIAMRSEIGALSQSLAALQDAWYQLNSVPADIHRLLNGIKTSAELAMSFEADDLAAFARQARAMPSTRVPAEHAQTANQP